MKHVVITVAGISERFNYGILDSEKVLKAIYFSDRPENTLLYSIIKKIRKWADRIYIVGGYQFAELQYYVRNFVIPSGMGGGRASVQSTICNVKIRL